MRRPTLRTRSLMVVVLLIALALAWNRRKEEFLDHASAHRSLQESNKSIGAVVYWSKDDPIHGWMNPELRWERWRAYKRAADAYEASAWYPWIALPKDLVRLPEYPKWTPGMVLTVPDDDTVVFPIPEVD